MNRAEIARLARSLMDDYGLTDWHFKLDRAVRRFGSTDFNNKSITVSGILGPKQKDSEVRDTILHEIAHALAGRDHGHDNTWKSVAQSIGANPKARGPKLTAATRAEYNWTLVCAMGHTHGNAYRRSDVSKKHCGKCYRQNKARVKVFWKPYTPDVLDKKPVAKPVETKPASKVCGICYQIRSANGLCGCD